MEKVADKFCVRDLVSSLWSAGTVKNCYRCISWENTKLTVSAPTHTVSAACTKSLENLSGDRAV